MMLLISLFKNHLKKLDLEKFNILLYALGTRGDVEPMLVLGNELRKRKEFSLITICATEDFVSLIEDEHKFKFISCGIKSIKNQDENWIKAKSQAEFLYALSEVRIRLFFNISNHYTIDIHPSI